MATLMEVARCVREGCKARKNRLFFAYYVVCLWYGGEPYDDRHQRHRHRDGGKSELLKGRADGRKEGSRCRLEKQPTQAARHRSGHGAADRDDRGREAELHRGAHPARAQSRV